MIAKFRERWEKLKESAKRKKEAKAALAAGPSMRAVDTIDEVPEPVAVDDVQVLSMQGIAR
jgi:hypothetical protein